MNTITLLPRSGQAIRDAIDAFADESIALRRELHRGFSNLKMGREIMNLIEPAETREPDVIVWARPDDASAEAMRAGLAAEYGQRYGDLVQPGDLEAEMNNYPPSLFAAPDGAFFLLRRGQDTIGSGAFMRHDKDTAELKRIWTHSAYRRQGLARKVVDTLELEARRVGYSRVVLSTGFRQPEAVSLYLTLGYTPLFDVDGNWDEIFVLHFEKQLTPWGATK